MYFKNLYLLLIGGNKRNASHNSTTGIVANKGFLGHISSLVVILGYQGWTGKRSGGADKPPTRRPGLVGPLHHSADLCPSAGSAAV